MDAHVLIARQYEAAVAAVAQSLLALLHAPHILVEYLGQCRGKHFGDGEGSGIAQLDGLHVGLFVAVAQATRAPNLACMSDDQARQIETYVAQGGSLLSTFETGLYDQAGRARRDFALGAMHGMRKAGGRTGTAGSNRLQRIERSHPLTARFKDTNWIAGAPFCVPIWAQGDAILTDIPPYPSYPTEGIIPNPLRTDRPTIVVRERGRSRLVYLAEDLDGAYWRNSSRDMADLIVGALDWIVAGDRPLTVEGEGLIEIFGWRMRTSAPLR